jgi:hypothetical protein
MLQGSKGTIKALSCKATIEATKVIIEATRDNKATTKGRGAKAMSETSETTRHK